MVPRSSTLVLALFLWSGALFHPAQSQEQSTAQTPPGQSTYVFHTNTRVVLTDVTVTDANDNPVHGLPQSVFRIFDNKEPEVIASFEEHTKVRAATIQSASTTGSYSNDYLLHLPSVLNIVLIDKASGSLPLPQAKKGSVPFLIHYTVPIDALTMRVVDGKHKIALGVAAFGLDRDGSVVEHKAEQLTMTLPEDIVRRSPDLPVTVDQQIELSKDDKFLHLGLWDAVNGRFGNIEAPIEVPQPGKRPEATSQN
jgi:hypothetical protein